MIRAILFLVAIGWLALNVAGLFMVELASEPVHAGIHFFFIALFGVAAFLLRPWKRRKPRQEAVAGPQTELLTDEIARLQRELDEAEKSREFAEELLRRRPGSPDTN